MSAFFGWEWGKVYLVMVNDHIKYSLVFENA